ncbi:hypothetical protein [Streptomyces decoyicus]|uniref:hypothetical protein n=1 Tax=Streptomyces decoyicus TaxID=249567 RepID=UPI0036676FE6
MIPSKDGYFALYTNSDGRSVRSRPVIAWDDAGDALVVGSHGLKTAGSIAGFSGVTRHAVPLVAAVPGGGWFVDCTDEDGNSWTDRVVAWGIQADGTARPITTDPDGNTGDPTESVAKYRIYHSGDSGVDEGREWPAPAAPSP